MVPEQTTRQTRNAAIANTIIEQLGGRAFIAMTGANTFVYGEEFGSTFLKFQFPKAQNGVNRCHICLDPDDTYTVIFHRKHGKYTTLVDQTDGIYCDMLAEIFTDVTGLATQFPRFGGTV